MRIALLGHHVAPIRPPFAGGVESLTWYMARWLARRGHEVTLFGPPESEIAGVEVRELALDAEPGQVARADVAMPPAAFMAAHHAYQQVMVEIADDADRFDLVHSHSLHYLPVAMSSLLSTRFLLTLHTPPTPWLESALIANRDPGLRLSAVSDAMAKLWADSTGPVDAVIPNGIDLDDWTPGVGGEGAVWCGRMVPEKAPHLAIEATRARAAGVRLAWVGGAWAHHQHHPTSVPPVEHLAEIVVNARRFKDRWGSWPMRGWLRDFAGAGLVDWDPEGGRLDLLVGG